MHKSKRDTLDLVSFCQTQGGDVAEFLITEGYNITHISCDEWLRQRAIVSSYTPSKTNLIVLGEVADYNIIKERLAYSTEQKNLAILGHTPHLWQQNFLDHFDDYIGWPCNRDEFIYKLSRQSFAHTHNPTNSNILLSEFAEFNIIGQSEELIATLDLIKKVSRYDAPTLITGETGTGKELAARATHYLGTRHNKAFIPLNCGAIPEELIENELFGHEKGAYTDAASNQPGVVELAHGGTLFLDEVDALPAKAQVALLRVIQENEYRPLGSNKFRHADIRIIAASNTNLEKAVKHGSFREDLLFRLNVLNIHIPPLRERLDDLELLSTHLLKKIALQHDEEPKRVHQSLLRWMKTQQWPGNIRQLENMLYRMAMLSETPILHQDLKTHFQPDEAVREGSEEDVQFELRSFKAEKEKAIASFEQSYLSRLMQITGGNISEAARKTGKERRALGKLLQKYNIDRETFVAEG